MLLEEPTALGQFLKKVAPGREAAVGDRIGAGWLARPTVLIVDELTDARVRRVADLIDQLGTARELHLRAPQLSAGGRLEFSRRLAGVNLASSSVPAEQKYYRSRTTGAQFASGGAFLAALLAVAVPALVIWGGWCVVKRLRPKPEAV